MEPIELDPGEYRGTYKLVGGRLCLDFVNTISWPGTEQEHDWLTPPENARRWFAAAGLPFPRSKDTDLQALYESRRMLTSVLAPLAHTGRPKNAAVADLSKAVAKAYEGRVIDPATLAWIWLPPHSATEALNPILLDAAELVTAGNHDRLRFCPSCHWLFDDQTRNGHRRWCDMADCGSRDKARRYYHRSKS
ncbi:CGNR zinc finger domain-containing protein [Pinirhizobacter sp.]|jgi:predicted RNA-binding Zn ribbon-like protein|uniref:CGNR zinc finger domain-containing protein n=1 Tax=Pinirhizobacter sp. TaxID=2950432 RepID=UPI002F3E9C7C